MINKKYWQGSERRIMANQKRKRFTSQLDRDIYAMKKVWNMLQEGFITWIGELGRRY